jgi:N-acetylmuramoyl-L-alanine amidase
VTHLIGWSHADEEPDRLGAPFPVGLALERGEWAHARSRGDRDVARSEKRGMRLWSRGRPDPAAQGAEAASAAAAGYRMVQVLNEPNLCLLGAPHDVEGWPPVRRRDGSIDEVATVADLAAWHAAVLDAAGAGHRVYLSPLSPGLGTASLVRWLEGLTDVAKRCRGLNAHVYGEADEMWAALEPVLDLAHRLALPVWIGECGAKHGQDPQAWGLTHLPALRDRIHRAAAHVEALCVFAPRWSRPDGQFTVPVQLAGTPVEGAMRVWTPPAAPAPILTPVPPAPPTGTTPTPVRPQTPNAPSPPVAAVRRIALSAGHHNTGKGDAREVALTGRATVALARELRARGADVRVVQPDDGAGHFAGSVSEVGRRLVAWGRAGWSATDFVELHGQALGNAAVRGCFVIYPDMAGDVDADVRDLVGPRIARAIAAATGVPVWGSGVLAESGTAVGASRSRLGVFAGSAELKATCTRMLVEVATFTNAADAAIVARADWPAKVARAVADGLGITRGKLTPNVDPRVLAVRDDLWRLKDVAWQLGRERLGDDVHDAVRRDKGEIA